MTQQRSWWRRALRNPYAIAGALLIVAAALVLVVWVLPSVLTRRPVVTGHERHEAMANVRNNLLTALGGLGAGLAAAAAAVNALDSYRLSQESYRLNQESNRLDKVGHLTGRFQEASKQMGDPDATVRLGGIQALAQLADEWPEQRQRCIDVLCAYVRNVGGSADGTGSSTTDEAHKDTRRRTIQLIRDALRPNAAVSWQGCSFDFRSATFVVGDFDGVVFAEGRFEFDEAAFAGPVSFEGAAFAGATVSFRDVRFKAGDVSFERTTFTGGHVVFDKATFEGGIVRFGAPLAVRGGDERRAAGARFEPGCAVTFAEADIGVGGHVSFNGATFAAKAPDAVGGPAGITFAGATFGGRDGFGSEVSFDDAVFDTTVSFDGAHIERDITFTGASFSNGALSFEGTKWALSGGRLLTFEGATATPDTWQLDQRAKAHMDLDGIVKE